jgi:ankyrin repeat protein
VINIEAEDNYGRTPLSWAARNGHTQTVQFMLDAKANVEAEDKYGWTPLNHANAKGSTKIVQMLTSYARDVKECSSI